ncbi:hypothetical protein TNCV_4112621 [Trichonephila clavipes]|nr:hypothetical protein TNCV_4112621 [Trichonephila clavipes]
MFVPLVRGQRCPVAMTALVSLIRDLSTGYDHGLLRPVCHEFKPDTTEDLSLRGANGLKGRGGGSSRRFRIPRSVTGFVSENEIKNPLR